jgi:hypothetical protein
MRISASSTARISGRAWEEIDAANIEYQLYGRVNQVWRGERLASRETAVELIAAMTSNDLLTLPHDRDTQASARRASRSTTPRRSHAISPRRRTHGLVGRHEPCH